MPRIADDLPIFPKGVVFSISYSFAACAIMSFCGTEIHSVGGLMGVVGAITGCVILTCRLL